MAAHQRNRKIHVQRQSRSKSARHHHGIFLGDAFHILKTFETASVDLVCTDPPYGISFMGKSWDKTLPQKGVFEACLRVLKPGGFAFVMCAPRSDVCARMMLMLEEAGFNIGFTPIYWTYASGFPKAANIGKLVDKRKGAVRKGTVRKGAGTQGNPFPLDQRYETGDAVTSEAKALDGSYGGFQPKPALEVVVVAMKPLSEKTFVEQAMTTAKGVTWLDDCRIPYGLEVPSLGGRSAHTRGDGYGFEAQGPDAQINMRGRFPANVLVSDDVLNDGRITRGSATTKVGKVYGEARGTSYMQKKAHGANIDDAGSYSRYFSLDAWAKTLPFVIVPKASKREKNEGLKGFKAQKRAGLPMRAAEGKRGGVGNDGSKTDRTTITQNIHPTVKPLKLMQYLITLGSRPGDVVLDPFLGSGTTAMAAKSLGRRIIGVEREREYFDIAQARVAGIQTPEG